MSQCPKCSSPHINPSKSGNAEMSFLLRLIVTCLRCYNCGAKFSRLAVLARRA